MVDEYPKHRILEFVGGGCKNYSLRIRKKNDKNAEDEFVIKVFQNKFFSNQSLSVAVFVWLKMSANSSLLKRLSKAFWIMGKTRPKWNYPQRILGLTNGGKYTRLKVSRVGNRKFSRASFGMISGNRKKIYLSHRHGYLVLYRLVFSILQSLNMHWRS